MVTTFCLFSLKIMRCNPVASDNLVSKSRNQAILGFVLNVTG